MERVVKVKALEGFRMKVEFSDGTQGVVELKDRLFGPVFEPLRDAKLFAQVTIDYFGAITWPGGADLAPDALYAQVRAKQAA
jgi:hypothetical protein